MMPSQNPEGGELAAARNLLLRRLSNADRERLGPHFQYVPLGFK